jgi:beta-galactosidase
LETVCAEAGIGTQRLPDGVRLRRAGSVCFAFNYNPEPCDLAGVVPEGAAFVLGERALPPAGVAAWSVG